MTKNKPDDKVGTARENVSPNGQSSQISFWKTLKRFLEPVKENKIMYGKALIGYFWWTLAPIISLILLKKITESLENGNKTMFLICIGFLSVFGFCIILFVF